MNKRILFSGVAVASLIITACSSAPNRGVAGSSSSLTDSQTMTFNDQSGKVKLLADADIQRMASAYNLQLKEARLIQDNDESFASKLHMIENAQRSIRMIYFIYAEDDSASVISNAMIKKAQQGVDVKLIVDFVTNYTKLDTFRMMEQQGNGKLKVYFYNVPSASMLEDAKYMTLPCPAYVPSENNSTAGKQCATYKQPLMQQLAGQETTPFSKMYLAGLFGKNSLALKASLGYGAQINPEDFKHYKTGPKEDQAVLFNFFKLVKKAQGGSLSAKLSLQNAMASDGATINPALNDLTGRLPIFNPSNPKDISRSDAWDHMTDYTHHKLVVVDGKEFQLGGRNIEDSYHMKSRINVPGRAAKGKYIFIDTDFWGRGDEGSVAAIEASYDKLVGFTEMVADTTRVGQIVPNEFIENTTRMQKDTPSVSETAIGLCLQKAMPALADLDLGTCIEKALPQLNGYKNAMARMDEAKAEMEASAKIYLTKYKRSGRDNFRNKAWAPGVDSLTDSDLSTAQISYIENVTYNKANNAERLTGSKIGFEEKYNKNIHALWLRGLENACAMSKADPKNPNEIRVIMHSAYLFLPSGIIHRLAKMLNGDYGDCHRVRVTMVTNSMQTTDLNVVNIAARYQLRELFRSYYAKADYAAQFEKDNGRKFEGYFPKMDYYEYNASNVGTGLSLHTKLSVLGNDMIIGSANADVRSYFMDTNNGVFIRNAPDLMASYIAYMDSLTGNATKTTEMSRKYANLSDYEIKVENTYILAGMMQKWDKKGSLRILDTDNEQVKAKKQKNQTQILGEIDSIGARIQKDTQQLLNFREQLRNGSSDKDLNELANGFDDAFKTL